MLWPKYPVAQPPRIIYKGYVEEGEGQYPIPKTRDWVEDLGGFQDKLWFAFKNSLAFSTFIAICDIRYVQKLKDRRAQIARYAFFTVPIVAGSVGFMGAVELGKLLLGSRKDERAWFRCHRPRRGHRSLAA